MAITFDAANSAHNSAQDTNSPTLNHTCASGAILYVWVVLDNTANEPTAVKYDGVSMTKIASNSTTFSLTCWMLTTPTTGSSKPVVVTWGTNSACTVASISLLGVYPFSPTGAVNQTATGTSTTPSAPLTTTALNSWILDVCYNNGVGTNTVSGTGQVSRFNSKQFAGEDTTISGGSLPGTAIATYTPSWTLSSSAAWRMVSVEIIAFPAITVTETQASTDTTSLNFGITVNEIETTTETVNVKTGFGNQTKHSSTWGNQTKS